MKEKIYCFDFDGTLTQRDTLPAFIRFACGRRAFWLGFLLHSPLLVLMKLRLYPNYKAKQRLFSWYFQGMKMADFDGLCHDFATNSRLLLREEGLAALRRAAGEDAAAVFVVSASIENWVRPFFLEDGLAAVEVLGTQVEACDGRLTGRFLTPNCYGAEKVRRIRERLSAPREHYFITAYGDSRGDKEMLAYADKGYFRAFE